MTAPVAAVGGLLSVLVVAHNSRYPGLARVSLSVEHGNPARRLYVSEGYRTVTSDADSDTMVLDLQ